MNTYLLRHMRLMALLLVSFASASSFAQQKPAKTLAKYELIKNDDGFYEIGKDSDYIAFKELVATGNPYANAVLTADITVKDVIGKGDVQFHYRGTFDGRGHTITLDSVVNNTKNHPWGLFQYTEPGCVIRNLKVSGFLWNPNESAGSIVGEARGTKIENCISDARLHVVSYAGGLVGSCYGVNYIHNCAFIGKMESYNKSENYGLIGYVENNVEVKNCYVDAKFCKEHSESSDQFMKKTGNGQIFLNNYYKSNDDVATGQKHDATVLTEQNMKSGKLCYELNRYGRNGIVWYQHGDHPYPFKGKNGQPVVLPSVTSQYYIGNYNHTHELSDDVCKICGALNEQKNVEPLQPSGTDYMYAKGEIYVGSLRYSLDDNNHTATVKGTHKEVDGTEDVNAVQIPESIRYQNKEYTVTGISDGAFGGSTMEYCYVPKTVTNIANNAFNKCSKLKYLYFADGDVKTGNLWLGKDEKDGEPLFYNSPLEKVYIGRETCWNSDLWNDAPFESKTTLKEVFYGPLVYRIGNHRYGDDPRDGHNCELFTGCDSIKSIYFMGSDLSQSKPDVEVWTYEGLREAKNFYVNRNINVGTSVDVNKTTASYTIYDENGIFKNCANVAFGPYVKYIGERLLGCNHTVTSNTLLKTVDFTNATRLERIDNAAFEQCKEAVFTGLEGQYPLKKIGDWAFMYCLKLDYFNFGTQLQGIGKYAFQECTALPYVSIPGTVTSIGDAAFNKCKNLMGITIEDSDTPLSNKQLDERFEDCEGICSLYLGRNISDISDGTLSGCAWEDSEKTLASITVGPKVTYLKRGLFYGLASIRSVSFEYSDVPLKLEQTPQYTFDIDEDGMVIDYNEVTSLRINRVLHNGNGKEPKGSDWGYSQEIVQDITFGDKIDHIAESAFEGFKGLKTLLLSPSLQTIGQRAFKGAEKLATVAFMGPTTVSEEAFNGCNELKTIIVGDKGLVVEANAFQGCNNIEEITIDSDGNTAAGSAIGFTDTAYGNAIVYSTYDTTTESVVFEQEPWRSFQNRPTKRGNDYMGEKEEAATGVYEHATVKLDVDKGLYEVFYAPFQWDSYYFGSDAEIYALKVGNDGISETKQESGDVTTYDINMQPVDLSYTFVLPKGVYAVKTKYPAKSISATSNFFVEYDGIAVDNSYQKGTTPSDNSVFYGNVGGEITSEDKMDYVVEDGVIKLINGKHTVKNGSVILQSSEIYAQDDEIYNIKGGTKTILTSKHAVPFHEKLEGYSTFYSDKFNVLAPAWCEVYVVTSSDNGGVHLEQIKDRIINAGQAVILKTNNASSIGAEDLMTYVTNGSTRGAELYNQNLLKGVGKDTNVTNISGSEGFVYVLSCNSQGSNTGFYKFSNGKTIGAGKAYLLPSDFTSAGAKACLFSFDDIMTGIANVDVHDNGQSATYDLSGRRVDISKTNAKNIYIINNKKVLK